MYQKLLQLEDNVAKLIEFKKRYDSDKIKTDFTLQWALRYGLFEAIQIVIDIACHLVNKYNLGIPAAYKECIQLLEKYAYIDSKNAIQLEKMIGLRNLLIHEYTEIDIEKLYNYLDRVSDFSQFVEAVRKYL